MKFRDYPVAVDGTKLRISWQAVPSAKRFLDALRRRHIPIDESTPRLTSYRATAEQSRADDKREIAALARSGDIRAAVAKAALVYMNEPGRAREVIAALRRGEIPGDLAA